MHGDPAGVGTAHRGIDQAPPESLAVLPERRVALPEPGLEFRDRLEDRRIPHIGGDPSRRVGRHLRPDVVDHQVAHAFLERTGGEHHSENAAHRRADPPEAPDAVMVEQLDGGLCIDLEGIVLLPRPGRQSAADRVGAEDEIAVGKGGRRLVEVAPGAGETMPHDECRFRRVTPLGDMHLVACCHQICGARLRHAASSLRSGVPFRACRSDLKHPMRR